MEKNNNVDQQPEILKFGALQTINYLSLLGRPQERKEHLKCSPCLLSAFDDLKAAFEPLKNNLIKLQGKLAITSPEKGKYYRIVFKGIEETNLIMDEIKKLQK